MEEGSGERGKYSERGQVSEEADVGRVRISEIAGLG